MQVSLRYTGGIKMKITVFTSNQPRHLNLIESLSKVSDEVFAVQECTTVFPGKVKDFFDNSVVMQKYFNYVMEAEKNVFGNIKFLPRNVRQLVLKSGDLNKVSMGVLEEALKADVFVVFGSSYIKSPLVDFLIDQKAINIHMGISPYYRGSSCNFWAPYDGHPELIGATIHILSRGLDSGDILYHALPKSEEVDIFSLGMKAVRVAHDSLVERIRTNEIFEYESIPQDRTKEYKYTKNKDFTDAIADQYLNSMFSPKQVFEKLSGRDMDMFEKPYIG